jgi:hypothetical protein
VAFWGERDSSVGRRRQRRAITTCVSDVRTKATLGGNQRRRVLRNKRIQLGLHQRRRILTNMCLQYESNQERTLKPVTNTAVISNGLKEPVIDRASIGNVFYELVTDRFNFCNGLALTSVTMNSCNGRLRSPLPEVRIGNGRSGGKPRGLPAALMGNGRQTKTVTNVGACNRC